MATGMGAHGSLEPPPDTDTEDTLEERMKGGIHADITGREATGVGNECNTRNEGGLRSDSGTRTGAYKANTRGQKKEAEAGRL